MTVTEVIQKKRPTTSEKSVVVNGIGKTFGSVEALRGISFEVARGEVVALLGPNGAGKTTAVDILSTLTRPDRGTASIAGFDVEADPAAVRRSIMLTGQQVALDDVLTGRENLVLFGRLQGLKKSAARARAEELLEQFDLQYAADRRVGTYSGGMRRRIDISCGLVVRPEVVFLDEPTTGLDPRSRQAIWDLVAGFKNLGISTLLTTQYLEEADALSDRIIVIDHGEIVAEGTADQLKERTGGSYCEIVPRDLNDLPAVVDALGSLLPEQNRAALTTASDRIAMPAPHGPNTLVEALSRLNAADIELTDIALRRPSLDDVFLALTKDNGIVALPDKSADDHSEDGPGETTGSHHAAGRIARTRSWLTSHGKALIVLAACATAATGVGLLVLDWDSAPAKDQPATPAVADIGPPSGPVPSAPPPAAPAPPPTGLQVASPPQAELAIAPPTGTPASPTMEYAAPALDAPITSPAVVVSPQQTAVNTSPAVATAPAQIPLAAPAEALSAPQAPPAPAGRVLQPAVQPATPQPLPPEPAPDPLQVVLQPLLDALP